MYKKYLLLGIIMITSILNVSVGQDNGDNLLRMVVYDKVNLREAPDVNSKIITTLRVTHVVKVIQEKNDMVVVGGNQGRWVYVDTLMVENDRTKVKGWIFDYYIADKTKFVPATNFKCDMHIYCSFGDFDFTLKINKNGKYIMDVIGGEKNIEGIFYSYKQALITGDKKDNKIISLSYGGHYYLRKDGIICSVGANLMGGDACAECVK